MKIAIIRFPSTNNELDMLKVLREIIKVDANIVPHYDTLKFSVTNYDGIIIPGGFSYGDYLRCGAIAAVSDIMDEIKIKHKEENVPILGICNGFQILTEANLLPGVLLQNLSTRFISRWVTLLVKQNALAKFIDKKFLKLPIAHFEGRYWLEEKKLQKLVDNQQIIAQYCSTEGVTSCEGNPNGSIYNIAGVSNEDHSIFGMMPHPERSSRVENQSIDGLYFLKNFVNLCNN
jgi:phosphoribosylformylglycinamidine synthase